MTSDTLPNVDESADYYRVRTYDEQADKWVVRRSNEWDDSCKEAVRVARMNGYDYEVVEYEQTAVTGTTNRAE